jgi:hypothetical protein
MCHAMIGLSAQRRETEARLRSLPRAAAQDDAAEPVASGGWRVVLRTLWAVLTGGRRAA